MLASCPAGLAVRIPFCWSAFPADSTPWLAVLPCSRGQYAGNTCTIDQEREGSAVQQLGSGRNKRAQQLKSSSRHKWQKWRRRAWLFDLPAKNLTVAGDASSPPTSSALTASTSDFSPILRAWLYRSWSARETLARVMVPFKRW